MEEGRKLRFDPPDGLYIKLDMQHEGRDFVVTLREHTFDNGTVRVTVPSEFRCDLGSLPWFMYFAINPYGKAQRGFLFHDVLYKSQICSRYLSDVCLRIIHRADGIQWFQRTMVYWALRLFAWKAWNQNGKSRDRFRSYLKKTGGEAK
jgi:hypothetical protein